MGSVLKILNIEDSQADFLLTEHHLHKQGMSVECVRVETTEAIEQALDDGVWDLILSDFSVPSLNFYDSFARIQSRAPDLPVILVSGSVGEEQAVELLKLGVRDFILKDNLTRLVPAVLRSLKEKKELEERNRAEELLRKSEAMYRSLFGNMMNGFAYCRMLFDGDTPQDFIYLSVNDAFETQTGLKNVVGRPVTEVIPGIRETDPGLFEIYGRVAMTGNPEQFEVYVEALKEWFWISVYSPEREHFVAVFDVVTERKNLEEQLRQSQKMEAVGQLAGGVAHDFNNIMQVIMGNAQLQLMFNKKHDLNGRYVDEIFKAVERGASLTRSLLVFSRKQPMELSCFDLNGLIKESHKLAMRLLTEEISLAFRPWDQALYIKGDPGLVQHVVFNLVTNARDAISRQGSIIISTKRISIDRDFMAAHGATSTKGHYALLTVKDNGCGISDQIRDRIFEPFFTTKEAGRGTGLGLAMIYGTVRQMNGFIVVESQPGAGTVIEIYIPLADENRTIPVASDTIRNVLGKGELLLVVEDEEGVRDSLSQILIISDYRVICAANAEEAITLAREYSSELRLAIMDMILPGMNGIETARELHQIKPGLPTLFLSGYSDEALESKGITGYHLRKPVHPAQLLKQIRQLLDESPTE